MRWRSVVLLVLLNVGLIAEGRANEAMSDTGAAVATHSVMRGHAACTACHMPDGAGQPDVGIPRLAGLTSSYIAHQLAYFASGARQSVVMAPYAAALSPAQRQEVADFFASLPVPSDPDPLPAKSSMLQRGKSLFLNGDDRSGLLSCSQCHGPSGLGVGDFSPRLAGQSAPYVAEELAQWHAGEMRDPKGAYMRSIAGHLTSRQIAEVAAYVASLSKQEANTP